jgi:hypothetical protein
MVIQFQGSEIEKASPYGEIIQKQVDFDVFWKSGEHVFTIHKHIPVEAEAEQGDTESEYDSDSDSDYESDVNVGVPELLCGKLTLITTMDTVRNYKNLGGCDEPGIDIYRNKRLCNSDCPIKDLGQIGKNLSRGEMRGKRCHMIFEYNSINLTDGLDMDGCVGLTSDKEISQDTGKWNASLLILLEGKAIECRVMYDDFVTTTKATHQLIIDADVKKLNGFKTNTILSKDIFQEVLEIEKKYGIFCKSGLCTFDTNTDKWSYLTKQPSGVENKIRKTSSNAKIRVSAKTAKENATLIIKQQEKLKKKEARRLVIKGQYSLNNNGDIDNFIEICKSIDALKTNKLSSDDAESILKTHNKLISEITSIISIPEIKNIEEYKNMLREYEEELPKVIADAEEAKIISDAEEAKRIADAEEAKRIADAEEAKRIADAEEAKGIADAEEAKRIADAEEAKRIDALNRIVEPDPDPDRYTNSELHLDDIEDIKDMDEELMDGIKGMDDNEKNKRLFEYMTTAEKEKRLFEFMKGERDTMK